MKRRIVATALILALILTFTGCGSGQNNSVTEAQTLASNAASEELLTEESSSPSSIKADSSLSSRSSKKESSYYKESSKKESSYYSESSKKESSYYSESSKKESSYYKEASKVSEPSVSEEDIMKEKLDEMLIGQNLGEVRLSLKELMGEEEMNKTFKFYDIKYEDEKRNDIWTDTNWTIRKWEFYNDMIYVGCEKTVKGIGSLYNTVVKIKDSTVYKLLEEVDGLLELARDLGFIKSKS